MSATNAKLNPQLLPAEHSSKSQRLLARLNDSIGSAMGLSSILWFVMRNDPAIKPLYSWAVFIAWSATLILYLSHQARQTMHDKLYVLLTVSFASLCFTVVAVVQKSSLQAGLTTAIPSCVSFAAYVVAYLFPRGRTMAMMDVV